MDKYFKLMKSKLEKIPGVSVNINLDSKLFKETFTGVKNNLEFFLSCMTRVVTSLKAVQEIIIHLEEFYRDKMDSSFYESELEVFQIILNSELLKIVDINKSTKYKGISLIETKAKNYIGRESLLIDIFSDTKFVIDFSIFNLDLHSDPVSEVGLNLGARNKLGDLTLLSNKEALDKSIVTFKRSFFNDFEFYRFNIERMLDKALSIKATIESKRSILLLIEQSFDSGKKDKKSLPNFANLSKHIKEDSKKIAQYV